MDDKFKLLIAELGEERVKKNELLKYHIFSKLGGPAEYFYIATSRKELLKALNTADELKLPFFIFGSGTKLLVSDKGIRGFVIKNRADSIRISGVKGKVSAGVGIGIEEASVEVESGASLVRVNEFLKEQNLEEINAVSSLQSTIGGSLFLDPTLKDISQKVTIWEEGEEYDIKAEDLKRDQIVISTILRIKAKNV